MKHFGLEKPKQFLDQVYSGCAQRECKPDKSLVDEYRNKFESPTSAGAVEKLPGSGGVNANIAAWSYDMEGHAKKRAKRHCEMANIRHLNNVPTPSIGEHQFKKEEELERMAELSNVCSRIVLKCPSLACIGRPETRWSVNKRARGTHEMDKSLYQTLSPFSFVHP